MLILSGVCALGEQVPSLRVMIADDEPAFCEGLCRALADERDIEVISRPVDGEEAVRMAKQLLPDVALISIDIPRLNGIEATKLIRAACPGITIIILSTYSYESHILASLRAGAAGYLLKSTPLDELISAVRLTHGGEAVFDLKATSKTLRRLLANKGDKRAGVGELRERELQVLRLAAQGMHNKEIAKELAISERTVQTHLVNTFTKLGVNSRTEAILHALKEGWLSLDDLP